MKDSAARIPRLGRFARVAADHGVAEVVPVAVGALQAGRGVDVAVGRSHLGFAPSARPRGRPGSGRRPACGRGRRNKRCLESKSDRPVLDRGSDGPLVVVEVGPVGDVPGPPEPGGHAADFAEARRPPWPPSAGSRGGSAWPTRSGSCRPDALWQARQFGLGLAGDVPAGSGMGLDLLVGGLGRAAAGHVPAEEESEVPGRQADGRGIVSSRAISCRTAAGPSRSSGRPGATARPAGRPSAVRRGRRNASRPGPSRSRGTARR
ncbi:MAG: hypothetical protein MZV64_12910 [Ignavibacteriales bacterium]|nr:hypothetical protein [Ignavibacteriales bacterium]